MTQYDMDDYAKNFLTIGATVSFAIPGAGPFIAGILQGAALFIPNQSNLSKAQIYNLESLKEIDNDFWMDATMCQTYLEYLRGAFATDVNGSNPEWGQILSDLKATLLSNNQKDFVAQTDALAALIGDSNTSSAERMQSFPLFKMMAALVIQAYSVMPGLDCHAAPTSYENVYKPGDTITLLQKIASYLSAAVILYNDTAVQSLIDVGWTHIPIIASSDDNYRLFQDSHDGTGWQKIGPIGQKQSVLDELLGVRNGKAQQNLQPFPSGIALSDASDQITDPWANLPEWYGLFESYAPYVINPLVPSPVPSPPIAQIAFDSGVNWMYDVNGSNPVKNTSLWNYGNTILYFYTFYTSVGESGPSPMTYVACNAQYYCTNVLIPAGPDNYVTGRRFYKTVIGAHCQSSASLKGAAVTAPPILARAVLLVDIPNNTAQYCSDTYGG